MPTPPLFPRPTLKRDRHRQKSVLTHSQGSHCGDMRYMTSVSGPSAPPGKNCNVVSADGQHKPYGYSYPLHTIPANKKMLVCAVRQAHVMFATRSGNLIEQSREHHVLKDGVTKSTERLAKQYFSSINSAQFLGTITTQFSSMKHVLLLRRKTTVANSMLKPVFFLPRHMVVSKLASRLTAQ